MVHLDLNVLEIFHQLLVGNPWNLPSQPVYDSHHLRSTARNKMARLPIAIHFDADWTIWMTVILYIFCLHGRSLLSLDFFILHWTLLRQLFVTAQSPGNPNRLELASQRNTLAFKLSLSKICNPMNNAVLGENVDYQSGLAVLSD